MMFSCQKSEDIYQFNQRYSSVFIFDIRFVKKNMMSSVKIKTLLKFRVYFKMTNHSTKYYHETRVAKQGFLQINSKLTFVEIIILLCPSFVHVNPSSKFLKTEVQVPELFIIFLNSTRLTSDFLS